MRTATALSAKRVSSTPVTISNAITGGGSTYGDWIKSSVSAGLVDLQYNRRHAKNPHSGFYVTGVAEFAGLGGDAEWTKFTARGSYYHTLNEEWDVVGVISGGAGHVIANGDDGLRIFDHFQNNTRMIRGFEYGGIGPYDATQGADRDHLGGTTYFNASVEAQFPLPLIPESFGLRGAVFADAATLYGNKISSDVVSSIGGTSMEWRASVGVGLTWASPFGPLRVDYAIPVKKEEFDETQEFTFGISTRF
jgi:outer membrane protein insertion porin family